MIKHLLLLIYTWIVLALNFIFSDVGLTMNATEQVEAGNEITVEVTLNKLDFESFARFQQDIPAGLTPVPVQTANADFSFKDQKVKFIWLRLPAQEEITLSYKLEVDQRLKGNFDLKGTFSYIADNERKSVDVPAQNINNTPSSTIDPSLIVAIQDIKNLVAQTTSEKHQIAQVKCIRQIPYTGVEDNEYMVNLLVNKGDKEKFAKIQETVPDGYKAVSVENKNAIFTFKDQTVKFLWMNLPSDPYFVVSYKLVPDNGVTEKPNLNGTFSYIQDDNTVSIRVVEKDVNLENTSPGNLMAAIASVEEPPSRSVTLKQPGDYSGKVKIEIAESALQAMREDTKITHVI